MHAYKCDLCKELFEKRDPKSFRIIRGNDLYKTALDLCPKCQTDFNTFIETHRRGERHGNCN